MGKTDQVVIEIMPELGGKVTVSGAARTALGKWSPRPGQAVTVVSEEGRSYRARVLKLAPKSAELLVFEELKGPAESSLELFLLAALPDKERMELVIEKATELGVDLILPWKAERGISLDDREARQKKAHRWQTLALRAAKQCRRGSIPVIMPYADLDTALAMVQSAELKIALWEKAETPLKAVLLPGAAKSIALLTGPEGGLTENEIIKVSGAGFLPASLGPRILRAETAALIALALAQFTLGDLGGEKR
jgi:16S rRNA (uracil1498-N3)-methyltransferase